MYRARSEWKKRAYCKAAEREKKKAISTIYWENGLRTVYYLRSKKCKARIPETLLLYALCHRSVLLLVFYSFLTPQLHLVGFGHFVRRPAPLASHFFPLIAGAYIGISEF